MSTSFVSINGNGFWMNDTILELFLRIAALHIEDQVEDGSLAHKIRDEWLIASRGYFTGCVPLSLGANVATQEGKQIVLAALESVLEALRKSPPVIGLSALNLMGMSGEFVRDFEARRLIHVGEAFVSLVNGAQFGGPGDNRVPMPGSLGAS
jgi:hypothetical protein